MTREPRSDGANSRVVTDAEIEALSVEAEAGFDVDELIARRGRRGRPALGSAAARVASSRSVLTPSSVSN